MNRVRYTKLMAGLASTVSRAALDAADMADIDDENSEVEVGNVTKVCDEIRERLLWIERAAHNIK